jgi:hypothetical protein
VKLTLANRIIVAVVATAIMGLLLFPPTKARGWSSNPPPLEFGGQMWIGDAIHWGIDVLLLTVEIVGLLIAAGLLMLLLAPMAAAKKNSDKEV